MKTHFITGFTMALKNLLGLVHARDRARPGNLRTHEQGRIYKQIADINRFVKPDLNLLDGFQALVSGGPTPMSGATPTIASPRIIIASSDVVATDVVGLALLRTLCPDSERVAQMSCWDNPMISAAVSAENGIKGPDGLELIGEGVPNLLQIEQLVF